jgi:hypothetical protein
VTCANPEGWQRVAGGRSGAKGERPPEKRVGWSRTPDRGARPNQATIGRPYSQSRLARSYHSKCLGSIRGTHVRKVPASISGATPISSTRGSNESGTPPGCRSYPAPWPGGRRPKKPSATSGYRLANPSGCLIQNVQTPAGRKIPPAGVWTFSSELSGVGQPGGLAEGSRWSFGAEGERPPEKRVGWSSTPDRGVRPNQATIGRPCSQSRLARGSHSQY